MHSLTKLSITELNPHLTCGLCAGYLIDAATITECLHSFCRSCILSHVERARTCPLCDTLIHKTRPELNIRADKTLQTVVYKLVPHLWREEMQRRRDYYQEDDRRADAKAAALSPEKRGEVFHSVVAEALWSERISVQLELVDPASAPDPLPAGAGASEHTGTTPSAVTGRPIYLSCPAVLTVGQLGRLLRLRHRLPDDDSAGSVVDTVVFYTEDVLPAEFTLLDVAHLYAWKRRAPLRLFYALLEPLTPPSATAAYVDNGYIDQQPSRRESVVASSSLSTASSSGSPPTLGGGGSSNLASIPSLPATDDLSSTSPTSTSLPHLSINGSG